MAVEVEQRQKGDVTTMNEKLKTQLASIATTIRGLSIDAIEAANSGHPGLPLGCAEIGAYLYGTGLIMNPKNPEWINRDRFILSAGHGSMLLYSCLHISGFDVSLDSIKQFRQWGSPCAGHPEYGHLPGVETTTGPLGQGISTAVGIALGHKILGARVNAPQLVDGKVVVLSGDGDLMEGISAEASSLAGHWGLNNLIVFYDANDICLDGPISECFTEDVQKRYEAYGWTVRTIDGHNFDDIHAAYQEARQNTQTPTLIIAKTIIGKYAEEVQGTSEVHGKALGADIAKKTRKALGLPDELFFVPEDVKNYFKEKQASFSEAESTWKAAFNAWAKANPDNAKLWETCLTKTDSKTIRHVIESATLAEGKATRALSNSVIQALFAGVPEILGGSADLSCSDSTWINGSGMVSRSDFGQRNIKYGVREFAMGAIASGLVLQGGSTPFCGTFLTFSDYMRNAVRLAALMQLKVVYQFTHDTVLLGEDGPTHQPVEHVASLRAIPGLQVNRPADPTETKAAWLAALTTNGPTALILSRQGVATVKGTSIDGALKGGYVIESAPQAKVGIIATGSELGLAKEVSIELANKNIATHLVSFPSTTLFDSQTDEYKNQVLDPSIKTWVVIEALTSFGWHKYIGKDGLTITVDTFGASAPGNIIKEKYGFTKEAVTQKIVSHLGE